MQVWTGTAYPLGATFDGSGTNFALFSSVADRVELCLFDAAGVETRVELTERDADIWHGYLPGRPARPALRLPGARAVRPQERAPLQPDQAAARPVREGGRRRRRLGRGVLLLPVEQPQGRQQQGLRAARAQVGRGQPLLRLVRRPLTQDALPRDGDLRGARQGAHHDAPDGARVDARHVRRPRAPGDDRALREARHHRDRAHAGAPLRPRPPPARARAVQLLGLQLDRLLRPARRLLRRRQRRAAGARVQGDGARAAPRRHRGHPRRGLQPHRRGQRARPDAVVPRHRQPRLLPARRRRPRSTTTTRPAPATRC